MATKVKGINIEIGAETTAFKNGLAILNKSSKSLQDELKAVNRALKYDPKNTELLRQKQDLLTKSVDETKKNLDILKQSKEKADKQMANGTEINQEEYRKLAREISFAETKLDGLKKETKDFGSVGKQNIKAVGDEVEKVGSKMQDIGGKMTATVTAPIVAGATAAVIGTREYREEMAKLETAFTTAGNTAEEAKSTYDAFYAVLGETDQSVEAVSHLAKMGLTQEGLSKWTTIATGVFATFGDSLPIEGLTEAANESAKVAKVVGPLADALNWAGVSEDEFNQKLAAASTEQKRQAIITETLNGLYSDASVKYKELNADVIASNEAQTKLKDALASLGATLEPLVTKLTEFAAGLIEKFNSLSPEAQKVITVIAGIAAVIGPLILIVGTLISSIGSIMTLAPALSAALAGVKVAIAAIGGPVTIIMALIGVLIAKFVHAYNTSEEFRNKVNAAFTSVKKIVSDAVASVGRAISGFVGIGKNIVEGMWKGIIGAKDWFMKKLGSFVNLLPAFVKKILGIHSPSLVFAEIGKFLVQGLSVGISENTAFATDEMEKLCTMIVGQADEISTGILEKDAKTGQLVMNSTYKNIEEKIKLYYKDRDTRISTMDKASKENIKTLQKDIKATENATKAQIEMFKAVARAKSQSIDDETDEAVSGLQSQLDAIDKAEEERNRKTDKEEYDTKLSGLYDNLNETSGDDNTKVVADIEKLKADRKETLRKQDLADEKDSIREKMDEARKEATKKKKLLEEELKQKTYNLEQQRNEEIEHMNKVIELMQVQVDKKTELEKLQTEIKDKETKLQTKNIDKETKKQTENDLLELKEKEKNLKASLVQDEINLKSFTPTVAEISKGYGDVFLSGFKSTEGSIYAYVDGVCAEIRRRIREAAGGDDESEGGSDGSHRTGLRTVPFDNYSAALHKGEMVLAQPEADRYRKGEVSGKNNAPITQNFYGVKEERTAFEVSRQTKKTIRQLGLT